MKSKCYTVEPGNKRRVTYPDKAKTYGITYCLAMGILNKKLRVGYLDHNHPLRPAEELIDEAIREAGNIDDLEIAPVGNICPPREKLEREGRNFEEILKEVQIRRKDILDMIQSKGFKEENIKYHLPQNPSDLSFSMEVDTEKLEIKVEIEQY